MDCVFWRNTKGPTGPLQRGQGPGRICLRPAGMPDGRHLRGSCDGLQTSYVNYYHLKAGSEQYEAVKNSNIVSILTAITGATEGTDLSKVDLAAAASNYMLSAGLSQAELDSLRANLAKNYSLPAEESPAEPPGPDTCGRNPSRSDAGTGHLHRRRRRLPLEHRPEALRHRHPLAGALRGQPHHHP